MPGAVVAPHPSSRGSRRGSQRERGATAVELAIIAPMLILVIFFAIQAGLFFYGRTVAVQAAREGVSQLRLAADEDAYQQMRESVISATRDFAGKVGRQGLTNPQVSTGYEEAEGRVWVSVTGNVISLVPGLDLSATAEASGTVERFEEPVRP